MAWSEAETERLRNFYRRGFPHRLIAEKLGRSRQAVGYRLSQLGLTTPSGRRTDPGARFGGFVARSGDDECWLWQGPRFDDGYGMFSLWPRVVRAHRFAFELAGREVQEGQVVMHTCDTPLCVNPRHLRAGTHQENEDDKRAKGRQAQGERHGRAVYSAGQVAQVRALLAEGVSRAQASAATGVKLATVHTIASGKQWKGVG